MAKSKRPREVMPKSITKVTKDGMSFESNVDRVNFTMRELVKRAQYDTAKLLRKRVVDTMRTRRGLRRKHSGSRVYKSTQYWVRGRELDLLIGFKHDTWYGVWQELGTRNSPKRDILRTTVSENIDNIREIQGKYLSAIEEEEKARKLIADNEEDFVSGDGEDD